MKRLNYWIRDYFGISQTESNGFILLFILLGITLIIPCFLRVNSNYSLAQQQQDQQQLDSMIVLLSSQQIEPQKKNYLKTFNTSKKQTAKPVRLFTFNPNTASEQDFITLGLPKYLAQRIIRYRNKGGVFKKKKDLLRIYHFPKNLYQQWEPFIVIPQQQQPKTLVTTNAIDDSIAPTTKQVDQQLSHKPRPQPYYKAKEIVSFDINQSDTTELKQIKGIGSKLSARIVRFRDKLGGFHSFQQLHEVYGLKPEVIQKLEQYAYLNTPSIRQISINRVDAKTLGQHPYISYKLAHVIVNYRAQHGNFDSIEALRPIKLINAELLEKLKPYLQFD